MTRTRLEDWGSDTDTMASSSRYGHLHQLLFFELDGFVISHHPVLYPQSYTSSGQHIVVVVDREKHLFDFKDI